MTHLKTASRPFDKVLQIAIYFLCAVFYSVFIIYLGEMDFFKAHLKVHTHYKHTGIVAIHRIRNTECYSPQG